jgi:hypothetical protein
VAGGATVEVSDGGMGVPVGGGLKVLVGPGGGGCVEGGPKVSIGPGAGGSVSVAAGVGVDPTCVGGCRVADANKAGCVGLYAGANVRCSTGVRAAVAVRRSKKVGVRLIVSVDPAGAARVARVGDGDLFT